MSAFYDQLAAFYHLVHQDWDASVLRQGEQLGALIESGWPGRSKVLDVTCGIGTDRLCELMREAGFVDVRRIDGAFYQPVLVGTRAA